MELRMDTQILVRDVRRQKPQRHVSLYCFSELTCVVFLHAVRAPLPLPRLVACTKYISHVAPTTRRHPPRVGTWRPVGMPHYQTGPCSFWTGPLALSLSTPSMRYQKPTHLYHVRGSKYDGRLSVSPISLPRTKHVDTAGYAFPWAARTRTGS
jgi:hypothetical protein